MERLKLPIIKHARLQTKHLYMDDYLEFINMNMIYCLDRNANRRQKRKEAVNVAFSLK